MGYNIYKPKTYTSVYGKEEEEQVMSFKAPKNYAANYEHTLTLLVY